jgi:5-methylcytosine-specific restriction endonuclease McrA
MTKTCTKCKTDKPLSEFADKPRGKFGKDSRCVPCLAAINRAKTTEYRLKNPEKYKASYKKWAVSNPDAIKVRNTSPEKQETNKLWIANHKDRKRELDRQWFLKNRETYLASRRARFLLNHDLLQQQGRDYRAKNKERLGPIATQKMRNRRALIQGVSGSYTSAEWQDLLNKYQHTCLRCKSHESKVIRQRLTPDHVIPLALGGANSIDNIQPLCLSCNCSKGLNTTDYRPKVIIDVDLDAKEF